MMEEEIYYLLFISLPVPLHLLIRLNLSCFNIECKTMLFINISFHSFYIFFPAVVISHFIYCLKIIRFVYKKWLRYLFELMGIRMKKIWSGFFMGFIFFWYCVDFNVELYWKYIFIAGIDDKDVQTIYY